MSHRLADTPKVPSASWLLMQARSDVNEALALIESGRHQEAKSVLQYRAILMERSELGGAL